jgi:glycosyltransferase involved in cell wall biosynthesis
LISKIAIVLGPVSRIGGTERRIAELIPHLANFAEVRCYSSKSSTTVLNQFPVPIAILRSPIDYRRVVSESSSILCCGFRASSMAIVAKRLVGPTGATVVHLQNGLDYGGGVLDREIRKQVWANSDLVLCNSQSSLHHVDAMSGSRARTAVIPGALSQEWFVGAREYPVRPWTRLLIVGNLRPEKNLSATITACAQILPRYQDVSLTIFTDRVPETQPIKDARSLLTSQLSFVTGQVIGPQLYDSFHALIHASISESLPRVVLEAKARNRAVIATPVGDTPIYMGSGDIVASGTSEHELMEAITSGIEAPKSPAVRTLSRPPQARPSDTSTYCRELLTCLAEFN